MWTQALFFRKITTSPPQCFASTDYILLGFSSDPHALTIAASPLLVDKETLASSDLRSVSLYLHLCLL